MSNMSYCRFQNTLGDLLDCQDALGEITNLDQLSPDEERAARRLLKLCRVLAADWDEDA
jgi:hypothetical protein